VYPWGYAYPRLNTTDLSHRWTVMKIDKNFVEVH